VALDSNEIKQINKQQHEKKILGLINPKRGGEGGGRRD
jgi:hypothetical protein